MPGSSQVGYSLNLALPGESQRVELTVRFEFNFHNTGPKT